MDKKKIISIILMVVLVVGCSVLGFFYGRHLANEEDKKEETKETALTNNVSDEVKDKLSKRIDELAFLDYLGKNISSPNSIPIEIIQDIVFKKLEEENQKYSKANYEKVVKDYFGDIPVNHRDYYDGMCDVPFYIWNEKKGLYVENEDHGGHGGSGRAIYNRIEITNFENDIYTVEVYKYISEMSEFVTTKFYATVDDANEDKNILYELSDAELEEDYEIQDKNIQKSLNEQDKGKLVKYTYKFDSNFALISYKIG